LGEVGCTAWRAVSRNPWRWALLPTTYHCGVWSSWGRGEGENFLWLHAELRKTDQAGTCHRAASLLSNGWYSVQAWKRQNPTIQESLIEQDEWGNVYGIKWIVNTKTHSFIYTRKQSRNRICTASV
jgi:hypothetical protein